ncbi:MAG: hypothetical protein JO287_27035 [Pseudonocardiales bacterium]|nr:hypothetical protein [Pseudonocardiales bacterium]
MPVAEVADAADVPPARSWRRTAWWAWAAAYVVAGGLLFLCCRRLSETHSVVSDGAANALQAWDMLHGNPLLRGWTVSDVSFYTTELPEYMGVELIRGLGPDVVHVAAALTYTLLVLLAGLLAKGRAEGREALVRVVIASGIMIAPQLSPGVLVLLLSPDHTGTQVPLLVMWLVLDRAPQRWWVPLIIAVMLTWVQIGDRITLIVAVVPLALVCAVRIGRGLVRREPLTSRWYEMSLAVAAVASAGAAWLAVRVIGWLGGYAVSPLPTALAALRAIPAHLRLTADGLLVLYGADFSGGHPGVAAAFAVVHLAGLALAGWALGLALWRFFRLGDLVVQVLAVAIIINLAAFAVSTLPGNAYSFRQIAAVLPLGAVLAGRLLSRRLVRLRLVPALSVILACYVAALGYGAAQPAVPAQDQALADWLVAHHLQTGLTGKGANAITLETGGRVQLLVSYFGWSGAAPDIYQSKASRYDRRLHYANFVVSTTADGTPPVVPYPIAVADFGRPTRTYHFRDDTIMIWDKNLLADLGAPRSQ